MLRASIVMMLAAVSCAQAQDQMQEMDPARKLVEQRIEQMMDPASMQTWLNTTQPSLGHEVLKKFVGKWDIEMRVWMDPSQPPAVSKGYSEAELVLGGRFVEHEFEGSLMGMPYEGEGFMGYDNNRKLFNSVWVSTMETGMHVARGSLNQDGTILTLIGEMDEPMSGEMGKTYRQQYHFKGDDSIVFQIHEILYGEPFKVMELEYTRCHGEDCGHHDDDD